MLSCQEKEYVYHDVYDSDNEEDIYRIMLNDLITPSFRVMELAEVFSGYQEIRSDRETALRYVESHFGTRYYVYYEYMNIYDWGRIDLMDDGSFIATPANWRYYWIASNTPRELQIESPSAHCYTASCTTSTTTWDIEAEVKGERAVISTLTTDMNSDMYGYARMKVLEPLEMPMCSNGRRKVEPTSGKVKIWYRSPNADKIFEVEFHESGKTFTLEDGSTKEVEPEKVNSWKEY